MQNKKCIWKCGSIFISVLMLSGCSTVANLKSFTTAYQEPSAATSSRLRVITDQTVRLVPDSTCVDWSVPGAGIVNSRSLAVANNRKFNDRMLGVPGGDRVKNSSEVYIKPGSPIVLVYAGVPSSRRYQCFTSLYFIPEAGADYEAVTGLCYIKIAKIVKDEGAGEIRRETVVNREAKICSP
ncbi:MULTISPECIES: hypothetical protein [Pseudomonas]|uniref:hypothetical protein n=1 Tax=Pseudomonas TaxID=286 RepID=UPI0016465D04|nr:MULTISPECIES: hypothetical protein [Pseudomonas]QXI46683.1 hypothetical protein HU763_018170 [Pseudomonas anuradhapurensis]